MKIKAIASLVCITILLLTSLLQAGELSEKVLEKKREGWYPSGMPLLNFDSDNGLGLGGRLILFYNGKKDDPYFKNSPYFYNIALQGFATTKGFHNHFIAADMPYLGGTKLRLAAAAGYRQLLNGNYYGRGKDSNDLVNPDTGQVYRNYKEYREYYLEAGDKSNYKYNNYTIREPLGALSLYYDLTENIKIHTGFMFKWTRVETWGGDEFEFENSTVTAAPTRVERENLGNEDGWINSIRFGIGYDTRDHEIDPREGVFIDYTARIATFVLGSEYNYHRSTVGIRYFFTLMNFLTFATRIGYTTTTGHVPFHELGTFQYLLTEAVFALGNPYSLRGYPAARFVGNTMTNGNIEARLQFAEITVLDHLFEFKLIAFCDTGSVFNSFSESFTEWGNYHVGYGGGLAIAWNQSFVMHVYFGASAETMTLSLNFYHAVN
ncbi:MAG: BamA/TamA family outer membrane protein [bacterium]|nr:BamA/TamA family outer membrane protein [bacterium]